VAVLAGVLVSIIAIATVIAIRDQPPERSVEAFCRQVTDAIGLDESLASFDPVRFSPKIDALERAAQAAPPEIAHPVDTVLDLTLAVEDAVHAANGDPTPTIEQTLRDREAEVAAVVDAGRALENYVAERCGFELDTVTAPGAS
jgi:hypothetical protein